MKNATKRAIVKTLNNGVVITRGGRGYSKSELKQSGVTDIRVARKRKIPIDPFRKTTHKENIEQLKAFLGKEIQKTVRKAKQKGIRKMQRFKRAKRFNRAGTCRRANHSGPSTYTPLTKTPEDSLSPIVTAKSRDYTQTSRNKIHS